jgi:predicted CoA-binding protein
VTDATLKSLLAEAHSIAVVGHSDKPWRDSYQIGAYLRGQGYQVWPVNPTFLSVDGIRAHASLAEVPAPIDIVDVFRASEHVSDAVRQAVSARAKVFWTQLGVVIEDQDRQRLAEAGMAIVEDRCIMIEHRRLFFS